MRRDDGENDRLRALVEGIQVDGLGTSANSDGGRVSNGVGNLFEEARS